MSIAETIDTTASVAELSFAPLTCNIGAEVSGIDLRRPLDAAARAAIYQGLLDHKVLFFRDQDITRAQHVAFARNFGPLEVHPFVPHAEEHPEVLLLTSTKEKPKAANAWHSDVTWRECPSLGSILRAVEIPPVGGDTMWADMYLAYENLPDDIKAKIDGAVAVHDFEIFRQGLREAGNKSEAEIEEISQGYKAEVEHPVVRTHPDTGRKALYVNVAFTRYIKDMDRAASDALLAYLYAQASRPEYQCRFRWQKNSIAFWDNRCTQHYAVADYFPQVRRMERVTIEGDRPF